MAEPPHTHDMRRLRHRLTTWRARGLLINNHAQNETQMQRQVETLAPYVDFIGYDELPRRLASRATRRKPFCLLTFDDGKAINAEQCAPLLRRMGIPAVFYLVTEWTGTDHPLWFDRLSAVRHADPVNTPPASKFKMLPWQEREKQIDHICNCSGVDADRADPAIRLMTWAEARELHAQGFEIGSHTTHHAILPRESPEEAKRQLVESITHLAAHGIRCRSFAFPNGNTSPSLTAMAADLGIESTVTTAPRWIREGDQLRTLPRLYLKERASTRYIEAKLLAGRSGCILNNPNGEGRNYRHEH